MFVTAGWRRALLMAVGVLIILMVSLVWYVSRRQPGVWTTVEMRAVDGPSLILIIRREIGSTHAKWNLSHTMGLKVDRVLVYKLRYALNTVSSTEPVSPLVEKIYDGNEDFGPIFSDSFGTWARKQANLSGAEALIHLERLDLTESDEKKLAPLGLSFGGGDNQISRSEYWASKIQGQTWVVAYRKGVQVACPQTGFFAKGDLSADSYSILDPASHRLIVVSKGDDNGPIMFFPKEVTAWNYKTGSVVSTSLKMPADREISGR